MGEGRPTCCLVRVVSSVDTNTSPLWVEHPVMKGGDCCNDYSLTCDEVCLVQRLADLSLEMARRGRTGVMDEENY